jgi:hypothetical protein
MMRRPFVLALALLFAATAAEAQQKKKGTEIPLPEFPTDSLGRILLARETYGYPGDGRRDPFASLIATGDIRPLLEDLKLTGVMVAPNASASMAMLRDESTKEIYKARVGSVFGRIRVTAIRPGEVTLAIDEFGFTRQAVLTMIDPNSQRTP